MTDLKLSAESIMTRADRLAEFSADEGQLTRAYLTPEHRAAHQQLAVWMKDAGLESWGDSVGNHWGRKVSPNPTQPTLIIGSHSDTVTNAGKYDGNLGVLLAIEALSLLRDVTLPFHVDVVAFADEEGTRFNTTLIGSSAVAGRYDRNWLSVADSDGVTIGQAMEQFGLSPEQAGMDARQPSDVQAYLEVHIEQGPVLEAQNLPVGVVTGIAGAKRFQCQVKGMAGHAGTVPIHLRKDAMCGVAEMVLCIESYAEQRGIVATVGICDTVKGAINVIPGEVHFTIDIRSAKQALLEDAARELMHKLADIAKQRHLALTSQTIYQATAVECNETLTQRWSNVVEKLTGHTPCLLPSGAGHDAMAMAHLAPIAMLFVRCDKGISHHPLENVMVDDVKVALDCFIEMIKTFNATTY